MAGASGSIGSGNQISTTDNLTSGANDTSSRINYSGININGRPVQFPFENSRAAAGGDLAAYVPLLLVAAVAVAAVVYFGKRK